MPNLVKIVQKMWNVWIKIHLGLQYMKRKNTGQHFVIELYTEFHRTPISGSVINSRSQREIRTEGRSLQIRPLFSFFF